MKILVTGSNGYLGFPLTQKLLEQGHWAVGLDTNFYKDGWLYNGFLELPPIIQKDIRSVTSADLTGFDAIVHLAELSNDPLGQIDPDLTRKINHVGTLRLARAAKSAGIARFVYFSSCSVYGASDNLVDETSPLCPLTEYARCKVLNEQALLDLASPGFSPVILRNATAFGPSPRMRFDLAINNLVGLAATTGKIKLESDGEPWRPFVHVLDIAQAVLCALAALPDAVHGQIFNVGSLDGNYQIKTIAAIIAKVYPHAKIIFNPHGADKRNYRVNFTKIHSRLPGFKAQRSVEIGVKELCELFERIELTHDQFASPAYTRLKQIKTLRKSGKLTQDLFWKDVA